MITSPHNEKLKLVRRLSRRARREQEELFVTEGEDLLAAGLARGHEPEFVLIAAGAGLDGVARAEPVAPELLERVSALGSGTRAIAVWRRRWAEPAGPVCVYLHAVGDPGNVGAIIRTADALVDGTVVVGPGCADPHGPRAVRATMGSIHSQPLARGLVEETPVPRCALLAHGGEPLDALDGVAGPVTLCLGSEREGLPDEIAAACERSLTIALRPGGAESLNVAAAAAIALGRISSALAARGERQQ